MAQCYTVGIKRRFLPGYRKFRVSVHEYRADRLLAMTLEDSSYVSVDMVGRECKVYDDYNTAQRLDAYREQQEAEKAAARAQIRKEVEDEMIAELGRLNAAKVPAQQLQGAGNGVPRV
jgi:hypothetical protein